MMQGYAGPVQQGDMVVRANEVSPGITALLSKQNRKGARGVYELPSAKQPAPNYYNAALDNVQNEIRSAARTVNAMAPEGERLAYVNPQEEGILKLLGGAGEPQPVTGIPSYYITQKEKQSGQTAKREMKSFARPRDNDDKKSVTQMSAKDLQDIVNQSYKDTGVSISDEGRISFASDPSLYVGAVDGQGGMYRYDKDSDKPGSGSLGASQKSALDKYIARDIPLKDDRLMQTLAGARLMGDKGLFTSDYNKRLQKSLAQMGLGGENIFGTYLTPEGRDYYQGLGGGSSKLGDIASKVSDFGLFGLLKNLLGGDPEELSIAERMERAKRAREALENQQRRGGRGDKPAPAKVADETTEEDEEEELPYFSYARRFRQPMTYEDIIKRAYEGSEGPLLESFQKAIEREQA